MLLFALMIGRSCRVCSPSWRLMSRAFLSNTTLTLNSLTYNHNNEKYNDDDDDNKQLVIINHCSMSIFTAKQLAKITKRQRNCHSISRFIYY